jgi:hypothetical protein
MGANEKSIWISSKIEYSLSAKASLHLAPEAYETPPATRRQRKTDDTF